MPISESRPRLSKTLIIALLIIGFVGVFFLARFLSRETPTPVPPTNAPMSVVTTFYPLADFAKNVGGDLVNVTNITPAGVEPHEYEPTPQDLAKVYQANVFLMNGNGVDPWADKLAPDLAKNGVAVIRKMSEYVASTTSTDPHFWLDPLSAEHEVSVITDAFILADPAHADQYNQKKAVYIEKLQALDLAYTQGLANCDRRTFVTSHNAFSYLAQRYSLTSRYILGLSPEAEPSAQQVATIARQAKEENIGYIFFETLVNPKLAQTIANEIGAKTLTLNPIEGLTNEELNAGEDYVSVMRENLANLRIALVCR